MLRATSPVARLTALAALCASACARTPARSTSTTSAAELTSAPPPTSGPAATPAEALANGMTIADEIRTTCELPGDVQDAPHFDFDSALLTPRGATILDAIGACLTSGGLASRHVLILGHTDPRGSRRYNEELGLARALAAKMELERVGVPTAHIAVASRGENDAHGTNDAGWARDRHIEVRLVP